MTRSLDDPGRWLDGTLPANASIGAGSLITGDLAFKRFYGEREDALRVGRGCTLEGVHFAIGTGGRIRIGDYCYLTDVVLLAEAELDIGDHVAVGWNTTIADSDFHPVDPSLRIEDAIACSPLSGGRSRPELASRAVRIQSDVFIGPGVAVLKGVTIGTGAFIEPGSVVTTDVLAGARMLGNPARPLEGV